MFVAVPEVIKNREVLICVTMPKKLMFVNLKVMKFPVSLTLLDKTMSTSNHCEFQSHVRPHDLIKKHNKFHSITADN